MKQSKYIFSLFFLSIFFPAQAIKNKTFNNLRALNTITTNLISAQLLNTININASGNITATSLSAPTINSTTINSTTVNSTNITGNLTGDVTGDASLDLPLDGSRAMTGTIKMPAGSQGAPSLTFTADTTSGIYQPAANELAISANNNQMIKIDATGSTINDSLYLNCATRFKDPSGTKVIELQTATEALTLSEFPNTSVFFLNNTTGPAIASTLTIDFDSGDETGRIITFVNISADEAHGITINGNHAQLAHGAITLISPPFTASGLTAVTLICYGENLWTPIWSHIIIPL